MSYFTDCLKQLSENEESWKYYSAFVVESIGGVIKDLKEKIAEGRVYGYICWAGKDHLQLYVYSTLDTIQCPHKNICNRFKESCLNLHPEINLLEDPLQAVYYALQCELDLLTEEE